MHRGGLGGLKQDETEAVRLFQLAAAQGYATAQSNLGVALAKGRGGLQKDEAEAIRLFQLAARQGDSDAQQALRELGKTW